MTRVILDVPNHVQTKRNACGPAKVADLLCVLTSQCPRLEDIPWADETFTNVSEMIAMGDYYGLELHWKRPITTLWIREQVAKGIPPIILVRYSVINPPHSFDGNHWVLVAGFDENRFLVNDPLRVDPVWISEATLETAMGQTLGDYSTFLAVYPTRGLSMYQPGINIDLTHQNPYSHPAPDRMPGMKYARVIFDVSRNSGSIDLEAAFRLYDPYFAALDAAGITPIIILNQETYGEGAGYPPWHQMTDVQRLDLFGKLVDMGRCVAVHYVGRKYVYQIWNQQDAPLEFEDSVGLTPQMYGTLYRMAKSQLKAADPGCKIITGGFLGGAGDILIYYDRANISAVCEGVAVHPYGQAPRAYPEFKVFGFIEDYINILRSGLMVPIWITEHGIINIPNVDPNKLVRHYSEFTKAVAPFVAALIGYPIVDGMHNGSGALYENGEPKRDAAGQTVFDALAGAAETPTELEVLRIDGVERLNLRVSPGGAIVGTIVDQTVIELTGKTGSAGGYPRVECYTAIGGVRRKAWFASAGSGRPGDDWDTRVEVLRVAEVIEL